MKRIWIVLIFLASMSYAATRDVVPRADNEGSVGDANKTWSTGYIYDTHVTSITYADGTVSTTAVTGGGGSGGSDNLGNHVATTTLNMADFSLFSVSTITPNSSGFLGILMNIKEDHLVIFQSSGTGVEDQPLIFINDDRTGSTANEDGEAALRIDSEASRAIWVEDGHTRFDDTVTFNFNTTHNGGSNTFGTGKFLIIGESSSAQFSWQGAGNNNLRLSLKQNSSSFSGWFHIVEWLEQEIDLGVNPVRDPHLALWDDGANNYITVFSSTTSGHLVSSHGSIAIGEVGNSVDLILYDVNSATQPYKIEVIDGVLTATKD